MSKLENFATCLKTIVLLENNCVITYKYIPKFLSLETIMCSRTLKNSFSPSVSFPVPSQNQAPDCAFSSTNNALSFCNSVLQPTRS